MSETMLRQASNTVTCVGLLKKKNVRLNDAKTGFFGSITIATDDNSEHNISVRANKLKKDGTPSNDFTNIEKFLASSVSLAELLEKGIPKEEAIHQCSVVSIRSGQLEMNDYCDRTGELVSYPQVGTRYVTQLPSGSDYTPCAKFDVECFIDSIAPEIRSGEPTGRLLIKTFIPIYQGKVIPFDFVVDESLAEDFQSVYQPKSSGNIWGEIVNSVSTTVTHKQGIGQAHEVERSNRVREYLVKGASEPYQDATEEKAFSVEAIAKAILVRTNETLPAILAGKNSPQKASGIAHTKVGEAPAAVDEFTI